MYVRGARACVYAHGRMSVIPWQRANVSVRMFPTLHTRMRMGKCAYVCACVRMRMRAHVCMCAYVCACVPGRTEIA
jgi:hypothetical protein